MKTTSLLFLSFLLFALFLTNAVAADPVLDTDGNEVLAGLANSYYIVPVLRGRAGGLTVTYSHPNYTICPPFVIQDLNVASRGLAWSFLPAVNPADGVVTVSTDLNIWFPAPIICPHPSVWKLGDYDTLGQYFVTTGGTVGNPGRPTINSWFKIEKTGDDYYFRFCPTVCLGCNFVCRDIGIYIDESGRRPIRLALSDEPFSFMFVKATTGQSSMSITTM